MRIKRNKTRGNLVLLIVAGFIVGITFLKSKKDEKDIYQNPHTTEATILRVKPCYKHGDCIDFQYIYNDSIYQQDARVSWEFVRWCRNRNGCKGMKFKVVLERENPTNILVFWEEMFELER